MKNENPQVNLKPFSYVDSSTGFIYFNLVPTDFGKFQDRIETALQFRDIDRDRYGQELREISAQLLWSEFRNIFFHEWHHFLQSIFYPYRYLQSWRELSVTFSVLSYLRESEDFLQIGHLDISESWRNTLIYPVMLIGIDIENERLKPVLNRDPSDLRATDFTITDLIEEATSIFEFKFEIDAEGDGQLYQKWLRTRKIDKKTTYSNVFRLLSKLMGNKSAYIALPALVYASFCTTWPDVTFVSLVNYTLSNKNNLNPEELGCDSYYLVLCSMLSKPFFAKVGQAPNPESPTEEDEYYFLDLDAYESLVISTPKHTINHYASRFIELAKSNCKFQTILFHPYDLNVQELLSEIFFPALIHFRIYHEKLKVRDSIFVASPTIGEMAVPILGDVSYSEYWREVMKRKDVAYSLITDLNNYLEHTCHHYDCPYYQANVCRRWSAIPENWENCPFPSWFRAATNRNIDLVSGELLKIH